MSNVEFDENKFGQITQMAKNRPSSGISGLIMKTGIFKSQSAVNVFLVAVAISAIVLTFIILS